MECVQKKKRDETLQRFLFVGALVAFSLFASLAQSDVSSLRWHRWEEGVREAHVSRKFLLVDVFTLQCGRCNKMDHSVYVHPRVQELLAARFVPIKLNAESETVVENGTDHYTERECAKLLKVNSYPTTLAFDSKFQLVARLNGYKDADTFIRFLQFVSGKHYERYSFDQYLKQVPPGN
jgi:thioredoxin-related protein